MIDFVTVRGINSGNELKLELRLISVLMNCFFKHAPPEERSLERACDIVRLYDKITDLINAEIEAADEEIKKISSKVISDEVIDRHANTSIGLNDILREV